MKERYSRLQKKMKTLEASLKYDLKSTVESAQLQLVQKDAELRNSTALILIEQLKAYGKSRYRWSEFFVRRCVIWRAKSPKGYETARKSRMLSLPSYSTLKRYIGPSSLDEGFTPLIKKRLEEEISLLSSEERYGTLMFDEMSIKQQSKYVKQVGRVIGRATVWRSKFKSVPLANKLLCFVLTGLSTHYKIPVSYHLTKQMDSQQQLAIFVLAEVEAIGFQVVRTVCDCISFNVKTMTELCGGVLSHRIAHPLDNTRPLFISFDPCHVIKNLRNQLMDKKRNWKNGHGVITGGPIRELYKLQENQTIKPVRSLSRKMVYPTSFEKMNVSRAVKLFGIDVTSSLSLLSEQGLIGFQNIYPTIEFMEYCRKWFEVHNVCNKTQHIRTRNSNLKQFWDIRDERLKWMEEHFLPYIESWRQFAKDLDLKDKALAVQLAQQWVPQFHFITQETYQALKITTLATVDCIRYLLQVGFHFVMTRRFNSDPVEQLISSVRSTTGSCDSTTAVAALYSMERIIKIGLLAPSPDTCVEVAQSIESIFKKSKTKYDDVFQEDGDLILDVVDKLPSLSIAYELTDVTLDNAGTTMIAGFIVRLLKDSKICPSSTSFFEETREKESDRFILLQDRGGLSYPKPYLSGFIMKVFDLLDGFKDQILAQRNVVEFWTDLIKVHLPDFLVCGCFDETHTERIQKLILKYIIKIFVVNITNAVNDSVDKPNHKFKPMSKKIKKL